MFKHIICLGNGMADEPIDTNHAKEGFRSLDLINFYTPTTHHYLQNIVMRKFYAVLHQMQWVTT